MLNETIEGAGKLTKSESLEVLLSQMYEWAATHWDEERAQVVFDVGLLLLVR